MNKSKLRFKVNIFKYFQINFKNDKVNLIYNFKII